MSGYDTLVGATNAVGNIAKPNKGVSMASSSAIMGSVKGDKNMSVNCEYSMWRRISHIIFTKGYKDIDDSGFIRCNITVPDGSILRIIKFAVQSSCLDEVIEEVKLAGGSDYEGIMTVMSKDEKLVINFSNGNCIKSYFDDCKIYYPTTDRIDITEFEKLVDKTIYKYNDRLAVVLEDCTIGVMIVE